MKLRKILNAALGFALCFSCLAGCGKKWETGEGGRVIYPGGDGMDDNRLTIFRWNFAGVNSARKSNTEIYKKLKDVAGMNLYASSAGAADWQTKVNTMFATQMLPDIFVSKGPETANLYSSMIDDGVLVCISDFVSETKYANIYHHLKKFDYLTKNMYYADGKHWSIPVNWTLEHTMYIRLDWIDNLNKPEKLKKIIADEQNIPESAVTEGMLEEYRFSPPEDLLEFYRLCRAFTLYDPDENGKNDTYGYTSSGGDDLFADNWMYIAFDAGWNFMTDPDGDGKYEPSWTTENTKKAISYFNDLYKSGYIDPSWYENSTDAKQEAFAKGTVGMMEGHAWFNNIVRNYISANTTSTYKPSIEEASAAIGMFNPPSGPNGTYGIAGNPNFWTVTCLNAGMSDEELTAALKLVDYMLSEEGNDLLIYGVEGVHFEYDGEGNRVSKLGKAADGFNRTLTEADACSEISSVTNWSTSYLCPYATNAEKIINVMNEAKTYVQYPDYPFLQTRSYVQYWEILTDFAEQEIFKMLCSSDIWTGNKTFEKGRKIPLTWSELAGAGDKLNASFSSFKASYDKQGGTKVTEDYNNAIAGAVKANVSKN